MTIIGVDIGLDGGIAIIGDGVSVQVMPTVASGKGVGRSYDLPAIARTFALYSDEVEYRDVHVVIEKQQPMGGGPKKGQQATFSVGYGMGIFEGIAAAFALPYTLVAPRTWQSSVLVGMPRGKETKTSSVIVAGRLFPTVSLLPTDRCRKAHDGMSDALLIAEYGRRVLS